MDVNFSSNSPGFLLDDQQHVYNTSTNYQTDNEENTRDWLLRE